MKNKFALSLLLTALFFTCNSDSQDPPINNKGGGANGSGVLDPNSWLIPQSEVLDGGPGKDGIPALTNPENLQVDQINYLSDDDLVIGFYHEGEYRAYPHSILDWHEIINDELNGEKIAITYCPLTGTGIGWSRFIDGSETTFGVSGLLYNTNLIPYDRLSDSNWCQISLECVNGSFIGNKIETFHLFETTWKTWREMFPNSTVVSTNTGFIRNYSRYPYGDYRTNDNSLLFPVSPRDERLPAKERVLTVLENDRAKVYRFDRFEEGAGIITDQHNNLDIIIIGDKDKNYLVAFEDNLNGSSHTFSIISDGKNGAIFQDETGNQYDLFGNVLAGADIGSSLKPVTSFMAYWFSVGSFYPNVQNLGWN